MVKSKDGKGVRFRLNKYGNKIRELREKNSDTLEELAKKMGIGWSALGKLERGERRITPEILEEVAKIYDVSISYFFGNDVPVPDQLKKYGVEWMKILDECIEKEFTPTEIQAAIRIANELKKFR